MLGWPLVPFALVGDQLKLARLAPAVLANERGFVSAPAVLAVTITWFVFPPVPWLGVTPALLPLALLMKLLIAVTTFEASVAAVFEMGKSALAFTPVVTVKSPSTPPDIVPAGVPAQLNPLAIL